MQLIKIFIFAVKIFFSTLTSLILLCFFGYIASLIMGNGDAFTKIGPFVSFFLAVYVFFISIGWTVIFSIFSKLFNTHKNWTHTSILWIISYFGYFLFLYLSDRSYAPEEWTGQHFFQVVLINTLKVSPAVIPFIFFVQKWVHQSENDEIKSQESSILDANLTRSVTRNKQ
jgi:hypothetical protein